MISRVLISIATGLCIIKLGVCDLESCYTEPNKIHLIAPVYNGSLINVLHEINIELNSKFIDMCSDFYDIVVENVYDDERMNKTHNLIKNGCNVIDLSVPDDNNLFYSNNDDQNLIYAGGIYVNRTNYLNGAKILSKTASEINSGDLLDFVTKMNLEMNPTTNVSVVKTRETCLEISSDEINLPIVLICSDIKTSKFAPILDKQLLYRFVSTSDCINNIIKFLNYLLAVLAPEPFDLPIEVSVSTIFYEIPYMNLEYETWFPNSMNFVSGLLLKHVFMKLIEDFGWGRMAIISDDTPFSIEFENELVQLFKEKGILYNVQGCQKKICNFEEAVNNLLSLNAKIVIANVDEENARQLYNYLPQNFNVLFRIPHMQHIFYKNYLFVSLGATLEDYYYCSKTDHSCTGIVQGLDIIRRAYSIMNFRDPTMFKTTRNYYSKLTTIMKSHVKDGVIAVVKRPSGDLISQMYVDYAGVDKDTVTTYDQPFSDHDDFDSCIIKTNDFAKYCDMHILLYFMFVVLVFSITFLMITCYFHSRSPINTLKYQQF